MAFNDKSVSNSKTEARNLGPGNQVVGDGPGHQINAVETRLQYNDMRNFNFHVENLPSDVEGIPSLAKTLTSKARGISSNEPTHADISDWLYRQQDYSPLNSRHHLIEYQSQRTDGTGHWVLQSREYQTWKSLSSSTQTLALTGILGSGKSSLVSLIIEEIEKHSKTADHLACVYFYFQRGGDVCHEGRVWATMLEQLLHQGHPTISPDIIERFNKSLRGSSPPHRSEYWKLFEAQVKMFHTVYLVLDALDTQGDETFLLTLKKLPLNVKLTFTSRLDLDGVKADCKLHVTPMECDIRQYVQSQIDSNSNLSTLLKHEEDRVKVIEQVTSLATNSQMFLLARLHMDELKKCNNMAQVTNTLGHLAASSNHAFERSIGAITNDTDNKFEHLARHVLTWVVYAKAPLTVQEIIDSFAIEQSGGKDYHLYRQDETKIISSCAGLVVLDSKNNRLQLVHESVQGYLRAANILYPDADLLIAQTCLACLCTEKSSAQETDTPLLSYAAQYWSLHLSTPREDQEKSQKWVQGDIQAFFLHNPLLERAFGSFPIPGDHEFELGGMTGLHAAVYYDLCDWAKALIKMRVNLNAQCVDGQTALHWAVRLGRFRLVRYLVKRGADTNVCDKKGQTPLHIVLTTPAGDEIRITQALLGGNARSDIPSRRGYTALELAIKYGPTRIAEMLLESRTDLDTEMKPGWTPLREIFFAQAVHFDRSPNKSSDSWKVLRRAFEKHVQRLFDLVLRRGADLNHQTSDGWLPLISTVRGGNTIWAKSLLDRKPNPARVNSIDPNEFRTPLFLAFFHKHLEVARLLLEHGANVNEVNTDRWTPLIQAAKLNAKDLVWLLLDKGAKIDATDEHQKPALHYAINNQSKDIVWLLVSKMNDLGLHGSRFLHSAMEHKDLSVAWLLCEHGADVNAADSEGMPPLHKACRDGDLNHVRFLLERKANVSTHDSTKDGLTPLHHAVMVGDEEILKLVAFRASKKGQLELKMRRGDTALILATLLKRLPMVTTLLEHGASCDIPGPGGRTALHWAARLGFNDGLQLMLSKTKSQNIADELGFTALHHAVYSKEANNRTIDILTQGHVHLDAEDNRDSFTPLMLAASLGKSSFTRQLLNKGADLHSVNSQGQTAIDILSLRRPAEVREEAMMNRLRMRTGGVR